MKMDQIDYCFIVKLTNYCNLKCKYCYHFENTSSEQFSHMSMELIDKTIERLIEHNNTYAHFIWHGGEPLLRGLETFQHIISKEKEIKEKYKKNKISISNGIQTNGTLLTKELIDFFNDNNFYIGISLDGFETLQCANRGMSHIQYSNIISMIQYLNQKNARYGVLCVINQNSIGKEKELFDFFNKHNIFNIGFLPSLIYRNGSIIDEGTINPVQYGEFLRNYFMIWINNNILGISVREFDDYLRYKIGKPRKMCINTGECDLYYTIAVNGNIYPCDCFAFSNSNQLGSVNEKINNLHFHPFIQSLVKRASDAPNECNDCKYMEICHGGCSYYRWINDKTMVYPSYFCVANKILYSTIDKCLEEMANE